MLQKRGIRLCRFNGFHKARFYRAAIAKIRRRKFKAMRVRVSNPKILGEGFGVPFGEKISRQKYERDTRALSKRAERERERKNEEL